MFSSSDIRNVEFEEVKRGYNQTDVKAFLRKVSEQIEEMERSNTDINAERANFAGEKLALEEKLLILADKVEEYRREEDSLKTALLNAQKLGDTIVKEAHDNAEIILSDARKKAEEIVGSASVNIENEKQTLAKMQVEVSKFKNDVLSIYKTHLEVLSLIPEIAPEKEAVRENVVVENVEPVKNDAFVPPVVVEEAVTQVFVPAAKEEPAGIPSVPVPEVVSPELPRTEVMSDAFYAPVVPQTSSSPFVNFSETPEQSATEPPAAVVADLPSEDAPSRFGALDFGDGFSFNTK